jgi:hypothetical protein
MMMMMIAVKQGTSREGTNLWTGTDLLRLLGNAMPSPRSQPWLLTSSWAKGNQHILTVAPCSSRLPTNGLLLLLFSCPTKTDHKLKWSVTKKNAVHQQTSRKDGRTVFSCPARGVRKETKQQNNSRLLFKLVSICYKQELASMTYASFGKYSSHGRYLLNGDSWWAYRGSSRLPNKVRNSA